MNGEALTAEQFFTVASDGFDKCEAIEKAATGITGLGTTFGGTVRASIQELTKSGFNFFQIAQGLYLLLNIVQKVGPDIMRIVEEFKQAWEKMKS